MIVARRNSYHQIGVNDTKWNTQKSDFLHEKFVESILKPLTIDGNTRDMCGKLFDENEHLKEHMALHSVTKGLMHVAFVQVICRSRG